MRDLTKRQQRILDEVSNRYLGSGDFNGAPLRMLARELKIKWPAYSQDIEMLIKKDKLRVVFSDTDANPHIIRFGCEPVETQLSKLPTADEHACVYPTPTHLEGVVDRTQYEGSPYTLSLALGTSQLSYKAFDLSVLEFYRNDPRYEYTADDIRGQIGLTTQYYESQQMRGSDRIFLDTFGFCYDDDFNRAVAVFVRYISDLSPEHQQIWKAKELEGDYKLHPDYYRNSIIGDWGERISIADAFIQELQIINQMSHAMGRPPLFRNDFAKQGRPVEFAFLVRPTLKEYNDFVLLMDKMLSDNINKDFFMGEIPDEYEETRSDGKIVVHYKNTITLLDEWIHEKFRTPDWEPIDELIKTLREVRQQRRHPAHAIKENVFDQQYIHKQRELIIEAYKAVQTIRLMFTNHPKCKDVKVDPILFEGKIWTF